MKLNQDEKRKRNSVFEFVCGAAIANSRSVDRNWIWSKLKATDFLVYSFLIRISKDAQRTTNNGKKAIWALNISIYLFIEYRHFQVFVNVCRLYICFYHLISQKKTLSEQSIAFGLSIFHIVRCLVLFVLLNCCVEFLLCHCKQKNWRLLYHFGWFIY